MLRMSMSCILIALLTVGAFPASAADRPVAEQVAKLKVGRTIHVILSNGETLNGRMGAVGADQFTLEPTNASQGNALAIKFGEVTAVKASGLTTGQKWMIFGVAWVIVGIVAKATL